MNDWIGLAIIGFIVLCALLALWQLSKPYEVSVEEFERRAAEAPSLLSAGFVGLQKILDPATAKAVEAQEDLKQGRYDKKQAKGDGNEAGEGDEEPEAGADGSRQEQQAGADGSRQEQQAVSSGQNEVEGRRWKEGSND